MQVLYIGGAGRSGSTLLEMILGNLPGYFSIGEVRHIWEYWGNPNSFCGCMKPLSQCNYWSKVMSECDFNLDELENVKKVSSLMDRSRFLPLLEAQINSNKEKVSGFLNATGKLYQAIWEKSDHKIIVDSSKVPSHLFTLKKISNIDLRVLHLVRDGRAVAYSWSRRKKKDFQADGKHVEMAQRPLLPSIIRWAIENYYTKKFGNSLSYYYVMRYEDFTNNPNRELRNAIIALGLEYQDASFTRSPKYSLNATHSVGGNPIRFQKPNFQIKTDLEWETKMHPITKSLLGIICLPVEKYCIGFK